MKIKTWVDKRVEEVTDVICDRCRRSCREYAGMGYVYDHELKTCAETPTPNYTTHYGTFRAAWGYGAKHADGSKSEANLCEECWDLARKALEAIGVQIADEDGDWYC